MKTKLLFIILLTALPVFAQTEDQRIGQIREIYKNVNAQIAAAENNFAESDVFLTELVVNKSGTMYPAVGNFRETVKFYYSFGNREQNPYPNRLLKIVTTTNRASRVEYTESLYNAAGQLIFYFEKMPAAETLEDREFRVYLADGKAFGFQFGEMTAGAESPKVKVRLPLILERQKRLVRIFQISME